MFVCVCVLAHVSCVYFSLFLSLSFSPSCGFSISPLVDFLASLRSHFTHLLLLRLQHSVAETLLAEKHEPLTIETPERYDELIVQYSLTDPDLLLGVAEFPITMPFSISVPMFCYNLKRFILDLFTYAGRLPMMTQEIIKTGMRAEEDERER